MRFPPFATLRRINFSSHLHKQENKFRNKFVFLILTKRRRWGFPLRYATEDKLLTPPPPQLFRYATNLRRRWGSNPRPGFPSSSFQDWCLRPLSHSSVAICLLYTLCIKNPADITFDAGCFVFYFLNRFAIDSTSLVMMPSTPSFTKRSASSGSSMVQMKTRNPFS